MARRILVTGFEPFGEHSRNPSQELLAELPGSLGGCELATLLLPVDVDAAADKAIACADELEADAVVGLGLADGRAMLSIERVFLNSYEHGDRAEPLSETGPAAWFTSLPYARMLAAAGESAELSLSAGLYVCNSLGYLLRDRRPALAAGFVHLPMTPGPEQPQEKPTMPLELQLAGVLAMLGVVASV